MTDKWIICDLDGTLCNATERMHFIKNPDGSPKAKPDWDGFNRASEFDSVYEHVLRLIWALYESNYKVALMTGCEARFREVRKTWLTKHRVPYNLLLMRREGDRRPDTEVKRELYERCMAGHRVEFVLEDRTSVVEMWRGIGVPCFQVRKGDY